MAASQANVYDSKRGHNKLEDSEDPQIDGD